MMYVYMHMHTVEFCTVCMHVDPYYMYMYMYTVLVPALETCMYPLHRNLLKLYNLHSHYVSIIIHVPGVFFCLVYYKLHFCRRNLEYYDMCHNEKVRLCDSDCTANSGELTVKIPKDTYSTPGMGETLVITSYKF